MATAHTLTHDFAVEHIGPAPHTLRNILIAVAILAMSGLIALFYWQTGAQDQAAAAELDQFRQAMAQRCHDPQFAGPTDPQLTQLYADSSRMRQVVVQEFHNLQRDNANCEQVTKNLRSVDFPVR